MRSGSTVLLWSLVLGLSVLPAPARGQANVHLWGGVSLATLSGDDATTGIERRKGLAAGASLEIPLGMDGLLWVAPGAAYVQKGAIFNSTLVDRVEIDYLEVPLLLKVAVSSSESIGFDLLLGPALAFQLSCKAVFPNGSSDTCEEDATSTFDISKSLDVLGVVGAGVGFALSPSASVRATALWDMSFTKLDESPSERDVKNDAILLTLGLAFGLGR